MKKSQDENKQLLIWAFTLAKLTSRRGQKQPSNGISHLVNIRSTQCGENRRYSFSGKTAGKYMLNMATVE